jgi:nicotinamide-nucleotide amidase
VRRTIRERLGDVVFGEEDEELEHVVLRMLVATGGTLATVEQGSGGALAQRLTDVADGGTAYLGGIVAPTALALRTLLDPPEGTSSDKTRAEALAECVRRRFDADFGLAVTDWPRVDPDDLQATPPACFVALATRDRTESLEHVLVGDVAIARSRAAKTALDLLRRRLLKPVPGA